ncbi:NAD(P)-dependent oxidoreductase [Rhizobium sullae]|uniref:NAD(P)-dependent oxidoreductase n=1 Tax=Rhizobium sullae TaxID=50338 RepID=UPI001FD328BC|nr:NAD(P)-dependent oxidoreductase [Rhizobium sullae]
MARGNMVDQDAVVEMLVSKQLGGAALDVLDKKPAVPAALLDLDNVVLSPQQGTRTEETRRRAMQFCRNLIGIADDRGATTGAGAADAGPEVVFDIALIAGLLAQLGMAPDADGLAVE